MYISKLREECPPDLVNLESLVGPCGLVSRTIPLMGADGDPEYAIQTSILGNPKPSLLNLNSWDHKGDMGNFDGAGGAVDKERAKLVSIAESLERYSNCAWKDEELVFATEAEIGEAAVSPHRFPQCSERELRYPGNRLSAYDPRLPIRWKKAWSLTRSREVFVPASTIYLNFPMYSKSEMFVNATSTGTATHVDVKKAIINGLYEVVERDSISLTWLQKLELPELIVSQNDFNFDQLEYFKVGNSSNLKVHLFDATTDFGIPVIYAVQISQHDPVLRQIVAATCDLDARSGISKIYRELASLRIALRSFSKSDYSDEEGMESVVGGAVINARPENKGRFDFLLENNTPKKNLSELPGVDDTDLLAQALARVGRAGAEVIVADLTTDEARQVDSHVVKVMIPEAMPLSFVHKNRYLATDRLYRAPAAMGMKVHMESEINSHVQPFA